RLSCATECDPIAKAQVRSGRSFRGETNMQAGLFRGRTGEEDITHSEGRSLEYDGNDAGNSLIAVSGKFTGFVCHEIDIYRSDYYRFACLRRLICRPYWYPT